MCIEQLECTTCLSRSAMNNQVALVSHVEDDVAALKALTCYLCSQDINKLYLPIAELRHPQLYNLHCTHRLTAAIFQNVCTQSAIHYMCLYRIQ